MISNVGNVAAMDAVVTRREDEDEKEPRVTTTMSVFEIGIDNDCEDRRATRRYNNNILHHHKALSSGSTASAVTTGLLARYDFAEAPFL
mmetsp:Transcript_27667/g.64791  ORF Transcript_27667/g.64791 Transcript_27667/m.64791 type:complete len:89 (-) Transcript_27667:248-514(-)